MPAAIIQARMGSTRLPNKVMLKILDKPILWHVINRVSKAKTIDNIIVATTLNHHDDIIEDFCRENNILVFRGSEQDVLDRYYQCAKKWNVKVIVQISADCPLHDPNIINLVVREYLNGKYDYVTNTIEYTFPDGLDVEIFSINALEDAWKNAILISQREHVTPYIRHQPKFKKKNVYSNQKYQNFKLSLDTQEDFHLIKTIYETFGKDIFYLDDIIDFFRKNPKLAKTIPHSQINVGYAKSLDEDKIVKDRSNDILIDGDRIFLRELNEGDASKRYCEWLNDPEVNKYLVTRKTTLNKLKQYIKKNREDPYCLFFGIFLRDANQHIGNIKLKPINFKEKRATVGIIIGEKNYWGKSFGSDAVKLLVTYAFTILNLEKIELGVISECTQAIKCYQKAGLTIDKIVPVDPKKYPNFQTQALMSIRKKISYDEKIYDRNEKNQ